MIESLVIDWLKKSVSPMARESGGTYFVEYAGPFKAVAIIAWLLALSITVLCFLPSTRIQAGGAPLISGGFLLLALYLHMEFFLVRLTYDVAGVTVYSMWGSQEGVAWHEIDSVQFSKASQNYVVKLNSGKTLKFSYFMSGYQSLLDEIQRRGSPATAPGLLRAGV